MITTRIVEMFLTENGATVFVLETVNLLTGEVLDRWEITNPRPNGLGPDGKIR